MYHKTLSYYSTIFYRSFAAFTGEQLQAVGLNFGLLFFVIYVGKHPGCSPSELTKALHLDWGYSQRSLNKLAEDGFLTKEKTGRSYALNLTDRGQQAFAISHQVFFTWDDARLANLNDAEKDQLLVEAGVTSFHVTLANHSSLEDTIPPANHPYFKGEGCFLKFCDEVRQYTDKPITGVGGLTSPAFVEDQLASGRITCATMNRQLLADPAWPNKAAAGQAGSSHRCVRCNKKCLGGLQQHQGTHCTYEKK